MNSLKKFWHWLWNSESIWSYIIFLIIAFIIIKFIFLQALSLAFGMGLHGLPLAIVESSSMEHYSLKTCLNADCSSITNYYDLCGNKFSEKRFFSLDDYWQECGNWYESKNITKSEFSGFPLKNGFRKGDIMIIWGWKSPRLGDVIVFNAPPVKTPIIHRVISLNPLATKGDHNSDQLTESNYLAKETSINSEQVVGVAVGRIPYLGWPKILFVQYPIASILVIVLIIVVFFYFDKRRQNKDKF